MTKNSKVGSAAETAPTMIIPKGTEITVDERGQLSVRAPGNLVIQHSGHYSYLESVRGSIRIEPKVEVEAVSVRCAETCYVQGSLTAWRVEANCLQLEDGAQANIVLQDTERLELAKGARLVGNFGSEKELFFLFSRFAPQVQELPFLPDKKGAAPAAQPMRQLTPATAPSQQAVPPTVDPAPLEIAVPAGQPAPGKPVIQVPSAPSQDLDDTGAADSLSFLAAADPEAMQQLPDPLFYALMALEQESKSGRQSVENRRALEQIAQLLRDGDLDSLKRSYRTHFEKVRDGGELVQRAGELIHGFFEKVAKKARQRTRAKQEATARDSGTHDAPKHVMPQRKAQQ